jgi:acetoacetate decarboxylase
MLDAQLRALYEMVAPESPLYRDAHYLVADVDLDPRRAQRFVPFPLRLASPPTASVFTAFFPHTSFGSVYREAGVFLHVRGFGRRAPTAVFSPWMIVDDDVALIAGRELLGYPKKLGEISFDLANGEVHAVASRRGAPLLEMKGTLGERIASPPPMLGRPHRNVRSSLGLALPKLVAFTPRDEILEVRRVELTLGVGSSARDPLGELGLGAVRSARLHRVNLSASGPPLPIAAISPLWLARNTLLRAH